VFVFLKAKGMLTRYLGETPIPVELKNQAILKDLLEHIGRHFVDQFPDYLWNREQDKFRGPVVISLNRKITTDPATRLEESQEVQVILALVGG
jgi:hypothetical protein